MLPRIYSKMPTSPFSEPWPMIGDIHAVSFATSPGPLSLLMKGKLKWKKKNRGSQNDGEISQNVKVSAIQLKMRWKSGHLLPSGRNSQVVKNNPPQVGLTFAALPSWGAFLPRHVAPPAPSECSTTDTEHLQRVQLLDGMVFDKIPLWVR